MLYSSRDDYYIDTNYYVSRYNIHNNNYLSRRCFGNILLLIPIGYCGILFYMYING